MKNKTKQKAAIKMIIGALLVVAATYVAFIIPFPYKLFLTIPGMIGGLLFGWNFAQFTHPIK